MLITTGMVIAVLIYAVIGFIVALSAFYYMIDEGTSSVNIPLVAAGLGTLWFMMLVFLIAIFFVNAARWMAKKAPLKINFKTD